MNQRSSQSIWKRKSTLLMAGGVIVAAAVLFIGLEGFPPTDGESAGAIGAADRYRPGQITDGDVILQDAEIQTLLQSDDIQRMLRDPAFQKAVKDEQFGGMVEQDLMRRVILDAEFMKLLVESGLAGRLQNSDFADLSADDAWTVLRSSVRDMELAHKGPSLADMADDAAFQKLFLEHEIIRRIFLDADFARQLLDAELQSNLREQNFLNLEPDVAWTVLRKNFRDNEIASRNPELADLAADVDFAKLIVEHEIARRIVAGHGFMRQLLDVEMATRLMDVNYRNMRPEAGLAAFRNAAQDAALAGTRSPIDEVVNSADFALLFRQHEMMRTIVMDADFIKQRLDLEMQASLREINFLHLEPDAALAGLQRVMSDAALASRLPKLDKIFNDASFQQLFVAHGMVRRIVLDADFMKLLVDADMMSSLREIEYANLRPEAGLSRIRSLTRDAQLAAPYTRLSIWAGDAEFSVLFKEYDMMRAIVLDADFLRQRLDPDVVSAMHEVDFAQLKPDVALASLQRVFSDASLASRFPDVDRIANDASFQKLFVEHEMVRRLFLDVEFMRQRLDVAMASYMVDQKMAQSMVDQKIASNMVDQKIASNMVDQKIASNMVDQKMASNMVDQKIAANMVDQKMASNMVDQKMASSMVDQKIASNMVDQMIAANMVDQMIAANMVDQKMASSMVDQKMASNMVDVKYIALQPDVALAYFRRAAMDAEMLNRNTRISDLIADQDFAKIFKSNGFARRALLDADFINLVADADFTALIQHKLARRIIMDVELASRMIDMELMNRRAK